MRKREKVSGSKIMSDGGRERKIDSERERVWEEESGSEREIMSLWKSVITTGL